MRVLAVHNHYQLPGGEDAVFAAETKALEEAGHEVERLTIDNHSIDGALAAIKAAGSAVYNAQSRQIVADRIARFRPDVMHVHNLFPLLSPSIFDASKEAGVASVWTLHNYRLTCANGLLFRGNRPCDRCVGRSPLPGVVHRCYRGSLGASAAAAASISAHRLLGTWTSKVDRFIALTSFAKSKFVEAGVPAASIAIKANSVPDPGVGKPWAERTGFIYVGRLSVEKGVDCLIEAAKIAETPLTIYGDGPERERLQREASPNVVFAGWQDAPVIADAIASAQALVVPSLWYENFPMVMVEAMAAGTPIIASRLGALEAIISEGYNGALFSAGDAHDLARVISSLAREPAKLETMGQGARRFYDENSAPKVNLARQLEIYRDAIETAR